MTAQSAHLYRFKDITVVAGASELVDIVLSRTQRRTPTVVHPQFKISRIRGFYTRKVKFCQQTFHDKFTTILSEFPRLDDIHPFYSDLCGVLYNRDHYKLALGQLNAVRGVIDRVAGDYVRLLKYADSPYKCKMLKRAALGRMCTSVKKLTSALKYLEEVRQHLSRLPSINPTTRSLILSGYPNVGKSSFMNNVTNANVEVEPYAFTTKSLYVGHFDYHYCRWQVIDTPGILDRALDARNTIEMTAVTALVHIRASIMYFIDISETCGFLLEEQVKLFHSLRAVFAGKPIIVVLNKIDLRASSDLTAAEQALISGMASDMPDVTFVQASCVTTEGIDKAKNTACDLLLAMQTTRGETKEVGPMLSDAYVTNVVPPAGRPPCIPPSVLSARKQKSLGVAPAPVKTEKDRQEEEGGAGVYSQNERRLFLLRNPAWKHDAVPEIMDGKNLADFVDPNILERLKELEEEEAAIEAEDIDLSPWLDTESLLKKMHGLIRKKKSEGALRKPGCHPIMPRKKFSASALEARLQEKGVDPSNALSRLESMRRRSRVQSMDVESDADSIHSTDASGDEMEDDAPMSGSRETRVAKARKSIRAITRGTPKKRAKGEILRRTMVPSRQSLSMPSPALQQKTQILQRHSDRLRNKKGMKGEGDRFIGTAKPKHLFSGKRGFKADHR